MAAPSLWLWCPLRVEAWAAKRSDAKAQVSRSGQGALKSKAFVAELASTRQQYGIVKAQNAIAILGLGGGVQAGDLTGDVIVASQVTTPGNPQAFEFPQASQMAAALAAQGLHARAGTVCSTERIVRGKARRELASQGAAAVDMESWWLLQAVAETAAADISSAGLPVPQAVIRVLLDTSTKPLWRAVFELKSVLNVVSDVASALDPLGLSDMTTRTHQETQP